jgi:hypothetical protein
MKNENKKTKRYLKSVFETMLSNIMIIKIMFILFTIETLNQPLNQIISYITLISVLSITIIIDIIILSKYGKNFKSMFDEE